MVSRIAVFFLLLVSASAGVIASSDFLPPVVVARMVAGGDPASVTREIWGMPVCIPRFEHFPFVYVPAQQTEVRLAYDDTNLYAAFRSLEDQMDKLSTMQTVRDTSVWKDDSVAIMLDMDNDHKTYYRLTASASGVQSDEKDDRYSPKSWDGEWSVVTGKENAAWTLLMTIPYKTLGVAPPSPGTSWGVNFSRVSVPSHERSVWTTVSSATFEPDRWGHLLFGKADAPIVSVSPDIPDRKREFAPCGSRAAGTCGPPATPISTPGPQPMELRISNPTGRNLKLVAEIIVDEKVIGTHRTIIPAGDHVWKLNYIYPLEGEHRLKFGVTDQETDQVIMRTPYTWVYIKQHTARIKQLQRMVAESKPTSAAAKTNKAFVQGMLTKLAAEAKAAVGDKARWEKLDEEIKAAETAVALTRCLCADTDNRGYVIGAETSLGKVFRDEVFEGTLGAPVSLSVARNEYESAQAVVIAYDKPLKGVFVAATRLTGPGGAVIATDRIQLDMVDWVKTYPPRYAVEYIGWTPDPIVELKPFDVDKGALRPIWITVHPSESTPPGVYRGKLIVKPQGEPESAIPIQARVWDFTLPTKPTMKTAFAFFPHEMNAWYGDFTHEMRLQWYDFLLAHRVNPTNIYSKEPMPSQEDMQFCVDRGLNAYTLTCTHGKEGEALQKMLDKIRGEMSFLKEHGWTDLPYVYGFDELGPDKYAELNFTYGAIKKEFPGLPTMTTVHPNPYLKGSVDIWVPLTANWDLKSHEEYTKGGDEVWWYVCCHPFHPWPNFFIDYPSIDSRIVWWMNWKYQVPGFLYYAINLWDCNYKTDGKVTEHPDPEARKAIAEGKRWPEAPWNPFSCATFSGDGQLVYPGPNGKPYSSMRFEAIRDGIEDYEYFHQLSLLVDKVAKDPKLHPATLAKARKLLGVRDDVVGSTTDYTFDPEKLYGARAEVAEMIERLGKR